MVAGNIRREYLNAGLYYVYSLRKDGVLYMVTK